jgi:hypothetical protein
VEVEDALALDERVSAHGVVAGRERGDLDDGSKLGKALGDAALALMDVHDDLDRHLPGGAHRSILRPAADVRACDGL